MWRPVYGPGGPRRHVAPGLQTGRNREGHSTFAQVAVMEPDRRNRISDLYHAALARAPEERRAFLTDACDGDGALRQEVESLLQFEPASVRFLETPAAGVVAARGSMLNQQIGPYLIVAPLGAGGMGEVYRARDSKLGRDVALKILPSDFTSDEERRARFAREARLLATLNHPHIGAIYGLEESNGLTALVLELVEGPTLADRLERGPLKLAEALTIARQVAEALDAAHEKGIVHRDLKPANIVLQGAPGSASDLRAKVLDFGLAKALTGAGPGDATIGSDESLSGTAEGRILGTPAYMSPEQARGQAVDKRTDIWAFGCVLFEMLSGRRPFEGATVTDTLACILEHEPDWAALPAETATSIRTMLERCLRKDPRRRLHDIADALIEVDDWSTHASSGSLDVPGRWGKIGRTALPWVLAAATVAAAGWVTVRNRSAAPLSTPELVETAINAPDNSRFARLQIAISPDGRHIAFVATSKIGSSLWVRSMNTFEPREIPDTRGARSPFWSPDSRTIGYFQERSLKTVPLSGGASFTVYATGPLPTNHSNSGGTWSRDGIIVFGPLEDGGLYGVSAKGGTPTRVTVPRSTARGDRWPWFLDDGQHFLYLAGDTTFELRVGSLTSPGAAEIVGPFESHATYAAGHLFFVRGGNLMAQRFDPDNRKFLGDPIDLGRRTGIEPHDQHGMFSVSAAGPLVYRAAARTPSQLTWIDRDGSPRGTVGDVGVYFNLDLSPDERRLAVSRMTEQGARSEFDIWTIELSTGNATRLTDDYPAWQFDPTWSPDGSRLAFNENPIPTERRFGLSMISSDGRGETAPLVPSETGTRNGVNGPDWSPADIIIYDVGDDSGANLWTVAMSGDRKPRLFLDTKYRETNGTVAPDGRWIAHQSDASGRHEVYVRPFPARDPGERISREGGMFPAWRRDGRELFFLAPDGTMMVARFNPRTGRLEGAPQKLFTAPLRSGNNHPYAVSADGQRFLIPVPLDDPPRLILDWRALISN
jgi:serine/threonine protein kinase